MRASYNKTETSTQKTNIMKQLSLLLLFVFSTCVLHAQDLESKLDAMFNAKYDANSPGATVLIAKDGKAIYRKAFGLANLELSVPMKPENVLEIGSITKQFTSVSILMLMEEGKLSLQDKITKFLPDYPTQGKTITVHHLLNHTSGIKSYTGMQSFMENARKDMSPKEIIDFFKNEPMDFDPGTEYRYNNSAYIILGYIIEEVSGMTYADFVQKRIFDKLGMTNSTYGSKTKVVKNRASGYQPNENGYQNANYLSMTLPYAGGSLMSCVDDMLKWQQALHNNTLISAKSKKLASTNYKLNNGDPIYYGYGFSVDEINGISTIEHGGGIFGYTCYGVYAPSQDVYAIVLTNSNGNSPTDITVAAAAVALGKPFPGNESLSLSEEQLKKWVGTYEFEDKTIRYVTYKDGSLYSQREGSQILKLNAVSPDNFYFESSFTNYDFKVENGEKVAYFNSRIRKNKGIESDKKAPGAKKEITLAADVLKRYEGVYELRPGFEITVSTEGNQIFAQATGQSQFELFAESETKFFLKVIAAEVVFNLDDNKNVKSLTLYQGGQEIEGKKK